MARDRKTGVVRQMGFYKVTEYTGFDRIKQKIKKVLTKRC
jgi:hypothetical protein